MFENKQRLLAAIFTLVPAHWLPFLKSIKGDQQICSTALINPELPGRDKALLHVPTKGTKYTEAEDLAQEALKRGWQRS